MKNLLVKAGIVAATAVLASPAFAAIDVSSATTAITEDGGAAIAAIGGALIGLAGTAVVFKWAKGAIFG
ncbi:major capsid protein [Vibrio plantisponsor]|uniref:major capsid protein n=1 Tax=Vibrio plantisponsor TaxID=664643 RepID=UPI00370CA307